MLVGRPALLPRRPPCFRATRGAPCPKGGAAMGKLAGKTVLVVGGTSGIGLSTGILARGEGARVVAIGRDPAKAYVAADALGEGAEVEVMDAGDRSALDSVV